MQCRTAPERAAPRFDRRMEIAVQKNTIACNQSPLRSRSPRFSKRWVACLQPASCHGAGKEAQSLFETAIARLPDGYWQVVQLYDLEGQTVQQIAKSLARSLGACKPLPETG